MQIALTQGFYQAKSIIANAQRCCNLYPERNTSDAPFPFTLYLTPGLTVLANPLGINQLLLSGVYVGASSPGANAFIDSYPITVPVDFPDNMVGSGFHVEGAYVPTATYVFSIQHNDSQVATLTVNTDGTFAYAGSAWSAAIGDWVSLIGSATPDATLNEFSWTFVGQL